MITVPRNLFEVLLVLAAMHPTAALLAISALAVAGIIVAALVLAVAAYFRRNPMGHSFTRRQRRDIQREVDRARRGR